MGITTEKQQSGERFNDQITRRYGLLAGAALSAKNEPAKHRQIVIERDHVSAVWAGGARRHNGFAERQPVDTHVQEAAKAQPQAEGRNLKKRIHVLAKC